MAWQYAIPAVTGIAGAIAGSQPDESQKKSYVVTQPASDVEKDAAYYADNYFRDLRGFANQGPGGSDIGAATEAGRRFATTLDQYAASGGMPGESDWTAARGFAESAFAPERTALDQSFRQQNTEMERLSARLGRPVNDPILQAKLRTGFMDQTANLNARQGAMASQMAFGMPERRLGFQREGVQSRANLATQAFNNRATLLGIGSDILGAERNWRYQTGVQYGEASSGGGLKGGILGGIAGFGTGMNWMMGSFGQQGQQGGQRQAAGPSGGYAGGMGMPGMTGAPMNVPL